MPKFRLDAAILVMMILLVGCVQTNYLREIPPHLRAVPATASPEAGAGLVVSVNWPAAIDPKARTAVDQFSQTFYRAAIGSVYDDEELSPKVDITGGLPIASTYFAAEAYMALRHALPAAQVILEPQIITLNDAGQPTERSLVQSSLPVAIRFDIAAPQGGPYPFVNETFTFSVRTPASLSGKNCGLFAGSASEIDPTIVWTSSGECVASGSEFPKKPVWYLDRATLKKFVDLRAYGDPTLPPTRDRTVLFPFVWSVSQGMTGSTMPDYVKRSRPATPAEADDTIAHPYIENFARIASQVGEQVAPQAAHSDVNVRYLEQFDSSLAERVASGMTLTEADKTNIAIVRKLLASETRVRVRRDHELARGILSGTYGVSVRKVRDASFSGVNKEMSAALGSALLSLGAMTAAGPDASLAELTSLQQDGFMAIADATNKSGQEFLRTITPSLKNLDGAWIEYAEQRIAVDVTDQASLVAALKQLYEKNRVK
ncbi:MAG: hypothetical protein IPK20_15830 [Betaproteobacteria bacterium]|nr:hypothetical protein [Betaproteobacteria bacterium]